MPHRDPRRITNPPGSKARAGKHPSISIVDPFTLRARAVKARAGFEAFEQRVKQRREFRSALRSWTERFNAGLMTVEETIQAVKRFEGHGYA